MFLLPFCFCFTWGSMWQVIVGSQEGSLQLWNISTKKKLYEFKGWGSSISSCVSSPALDVVAVGCSDGKIHVHNVRYDEELVTFTHAMRGAVTALAFSSGKSSDICVYNSIPLLLLLYLLKLNCYVASCSLAPSMFIFLGKLIKKTCWRNFQYLGFSIAAKKWCPISQLLLLLLLSFYIKLSLQIPINVACSVCSIILRIETFILW